MGHDRDDVLARVDLDGLADRLLGAHHPRTKTWACPNPDHAQTGRTPPVSTFTDRRGGRRWHCHSCGEGGTAIDLVLASGQARDFVDALDWLAGYAGLPPAPEPNRGHRAWRTGAGRPGRSPLTAPFEGGPSGRRRSQ